MRLRFFLLLMIFPFCCYSQQKVDYVVPGIIPFLRQPKDMDCWITVATMMISWKEKKKYSVEEIAKRLGDPWKLYYDLNSGLPEMDTQKFLKAVQMKGEAPANHTIEAYLRFLKDYGPIWITTGDGISAHARILIGLTGSGAYESTKFLLIDPRDGSKVEKEAMAFLKEFEEEAKIANEEGWESLRIQIYHF